MRSRLLVLLAILAPAARAEDYPSLPVPPGIVAQDVPPIPRSLKRRVEPYWGTNWTQFHGWYGGRREMLVGVGQVYHLRGPDEGEIEPLTAFPRMVSGAYPRPGHEEFLVSVDREGREEDRLYLVSPLRGRTVPLTPDRAESFYPAWSRSGRYLAYSDTPFTRGSEAVRFLEPPGAKVLREYRDLGPCPVVHAWSPDNRRVVVITNRVPGRNNVLLVDVATGKAEPVGASQADAHDTGTWRKLPLRWSRDGKSLFWTTLINSDFVRLLRYDLESKRETPLGEAIRWDVEEFDLADDGRTLALLANEDGASVLHVLDAGTGKERPAPEMPIGIASDLAFRPGSTELAFTLKSPGFPARVHSYDLATGRAERWKLGQDGLNLGATADPEVVRYPSFDGRMIPALVTRPPANFPPPYPVAIFLHGGPIAQCRPDHLGYLSYLVNGLGIAVIRPNYRGSIGYGNRYECLDDGPDREGAIKDMGALLDWIAARPDLDRSRVAVTGSSYGGFLALATLASHGDRLVAGVDDCGISDLASHVSGRPEGQKDWALAEYGDPADAKMAEVFLAVSPLANAARIKTPLLVIHGANDPRVPVAEAARIVEAVRANGVPVWCILGRGEGHSFLDLDNYRFRILAEILFLKKYLQPPTPDVRSAKNQRATTHLAE